MNIVLRKVIFLSILITISLSSCTRGKNDPEADQSFLTDQPCAAPCWHGLAPGESNEQQTLETLSDLSFVDHQSIKEYITSWPGSNLAKSIRFGCTHPKIDFCGEIVVADNTLKQIYLITNPIEVITTLNKLGPPEFVDVAIYAPHQGGCIINLNWPQPGILLQQKDPSSYELSDLIESGKSIPKNTKFDVLIYMVSEEFHRFQTEIIKSYDWPGLGEP